MIYEMTLRLPKAKRKMMLPFVPSYKDTIKQYRKKYGRLPTKRPSRTLQPAPNFLAALRADPDLYPEALAVFYKINTLPLTKKSFVSFNELSKKTLGSIQQLAIFRTYVVHPLLTNGLSCIEIKTRIRKKNLHYYRQRLTHSCRSKLYTWVKNLRRVEIVIDSSKSQLFASYAMKKYMAMYWRHVDFFVLRHIGLRGEDEGDENGRWRGRGGGGA